MFTPSSNGIVQKKKLDTIHGRVDGEEAIRSDGESGSSSESEDSVINHIIDDGEEDDYVWSLIKYLYDKDVLKHIFTLLVMYIQSKDDTVIQNIMKEADKLEDGGMKIEEALAVAVVKYKKAIQMKMI